MLKQSLLMSIAFISLSPIKAAQSTQPQHAQNPTHHPAAQKPAHPDAAHHDAAQHGQNPAHHDATQAAKDSSHCPPCASGSVGGWVLIPAGPGTTCHEGAGGKTHESETTHKPTGEHHVTHHQPADEPIKPTEEPHKPTVKPSLHPLPTPEEEALEAQLKPIQAHIFKKADPNFPDREKQGEWGKALNGKVYFRVLGIWKHDPSVNATTDIIPTGVKDKIKMFDQMGQKQQPQKPTSKPAAKPAEKPVEKPVDAAVAVAEKPISDGGNLPPTTTTKPPAPPRIAPPTAAGAKKSWPKVNVPDVLGTTQGRVQSAYTNPTKGNELELGLGAPNRAQTGVTGQAIPEADTSEAKPPVAPPSNIAQ